MGQCSRSAWKPECISAATQRACARAAADLGHRAGGSSDASRPETPGWRGCPRSRGRPPAAPAPCRRANGRESALWRRARAGRCRSRRRRCRRGAWRARGAGSSSTYSCCQSPICRPCDAPVHKSPARRGAGIVIAPHAADNARRSPQACFTNAPMPASENDHRLRGRRRAGAGRQRGESIPIWIARDADWTRQARPHRGAAGLGGGPGLQGRRQEAPALARQRRQACRRGPRPRGGARARSDGQAGAGGWACCRACCRPGLYHLAGAVEDGELAAVAWGLGAYRFRRYKSGNGEAAARPSSSCRPAPILARAARHRRRRLAGTRPHQYAGRRPGAGGAGGGGAPARRAARRERHAASSATTCRPRISP